MYPILLHSLVFPLGAHTSNATLESALFTVNIAQCRCYPFPLIIVATFLTQYPISFIHLMKNTSQKSELMQAVNIFPACELFNAQELFLTVTLHTCHDKPGLKTCMHQVKQTE